MDTPDQVARWIEDTRVATHAAAASVWDKGVLASAHRAETYFDLASLTKPVLALAILRSGLDVRTKLAALVPEANGTATAEVTLEALLSHRAGLQGHLLLDPADALRTAALARLHPQTADCAPLYVTPHYSDLGYILAGVAFARWAKTVDAGAAMQHFVLDPLGLSNRMGTLRDLDLEETRCAPTEVRGRVHDENAWALTGSGGSGHAGLFGTIGGVADLVKHFVEQRDLLDWMTIERPGGTLRAGFDGKSAEGSSAGSVLGPRSFGHLGFTGTSFWIDPDAAVGVVLLTNRVYPTRINDAIRAARPTAHDALATIARNSRSR